MLDHETQITTEGADPHRRTAEAAAADMEVDATDDLDPDLETADMAETDETDLDRATDPTEGRRRGQAAGV